MMTESMNVEELQKLEDCYQNLKLLQGKLRACLRGDSEVAELPDLIEARKKELAKLQQLDLAMEKKLPELPEAVAKNAKTALLDLGQRFEQLAVSEQDILANLEAAASVNPDIQHKKQGSKSGGNLDVSQ